MVGGQLTRHSPFVLLRRGVRSALPEADKLPE